MKDVAITAVGIAIGVLILKVFYSAIRTSWPENYVSVTGDYGVVVNRTLLKYAAFRLVPAYAVALLVSQMAGRYGGHPMYVAILIGVLHATQSSLRHLVAVFRRRSPEHIRIAAILVDLVTSICVVAVALVGGFGTGPLTAIVPPLDEFFKSFWTTAVVAVLAVYVLNLSRATREAAALVRRSRAELGPLVNRAREEARSLQVNADLVEAVLLTENLERPAWVRRLERLKGSVAANGTYGVMQVTAEHPIDDEESIREGVRRLAHVPLALDEYGVDADSLNASLRAYNNDNDFVDLARLLFWEISQTTAESPLQGTSEDAAERRSGGNLPNDGDGTKERVALTVKVVTGMTARIQTPDGVQAIALSPLDDLRTLAAIIDRLPTVESKQEHDLRIELETRLTAEAMSLQADSVEPTEPTATA